MKRSILLLLFIGSMICSNAQIRRTVWGITLGSSKESAIAILIEKGAVSQDSYYLINGQNEIYCCPGIFHFAGATWNTVSVTFTNGKVTYINFSRSQTDHVTDMAIRKAYREKYSEYKYENLSGFGLEMYTDGKTRIFLSFEKDDEPLISISYHDITEYNIENDI